jgi:nicotinamidase-related amidase
MKQVNGLDIPTGLADLCASGRIALLIYDMQLGIARQIKSGAEITERSERIIAAARRAGVRVVYTRHLSLSKSWMGVTQYRMAMAWQRKDDPADVSPWFLRGTEGFEIVPELAPTADDAVFDKLAMSAFEGTPLEFALRDCGILGVIIAGIATEIGIEPTARHAADLGFIPIIVTDACGAGHAEAGARSIESLRFMGDALFTDENEITTLLERMAESDSSEDVEVVTA